MPSKRRKEKVHWLIEHRKERYYSAIQNFIDGKVPQTYVDERYRKLKEIS
jgi:hypothetical protein